MPSPVRGIAVLIAAFAALLAAASCSQPMADVLDPGEIQIAVEQFGAGGAARPGEWTGLRLSLIDSSDRQREVLVRVAVDDADGDRPWYEAVVTTNPGVRQPLWMYVRLPFGFRAGDTLAVTAFAAEEAPALAHTGLAFDSGRVLGSLRIPAGRLLGPTEGMIGVVDRRPLGLARYGINAGQSPWLPSGHERSEIVTGLDPAGMPDRWMGLAQFDVIVWGEPSPNTLSAERAQALREWVLRGGHLVIALPTVGQTWTDELNNPLYDIVPKVRVRAREAVNLNAYRSLLTASPTALLPTNAIVQEMIPREDAEPGQAVRIIDAVPGESAESAGGGLPAVAVRRLVGVGAVTFVGLDLGSPGLAARGLPDADQFWHRILGRRGELLTREELTARAGDQSVVSGMMLTRETVSLDRDIADLIAKSGWASAGVLLGFVVFVAYWVLAGPGGFALLKLKGLTRHAWLAFLATAGLFTAIAWGGAAALRPKQVDGTHLTFLDHVYGQPVQRARAWMSVLIPEYGETGVSIGDPARLADPASRPALHNAMTPWEPPNIGLGGGAGGFPDARGYRINARTPDTAFVPTRATVKQFQFDWAGGPRWQMPRPVAPEGAEGPADIRLWDGTRDRTEPGQLAPAALGALRHDLPGPLTDVVIVINRGQVPLSTGQARGQGALVDAVAFKLPAPWQPGTPLDLAAATRKLTPQQNIDARQYFEQLLSAGQADSLTGAAVSDAGNIGTRLYAATFYSQLPPPDYTDRSSRVRRLAARSATHGLDLGHWFSQPCLIVVGQLAADAPSPVPVSVNTGGGWEPVLTQGRTVVRWVYPLPAAPPAYPRAAIEGQIGPDETDPMEGSPGEEGPP